MPNFGQSFTWGNPRRDLRASDADRERVVDDLRQHAGDGRITMDELNDRMEKAYHSKTLADLDDLIRDLPVPANRPMAARPPSPFQRQKPSKRPRKPMWLVGLRLLVLDLIMVAIWLAAGAHGSFWPMWVFLGTGIVFTLRALRRFERQVTARNQLGTGSTSG